MGKRAQSAMRKQKNEMDSNIDMNTSGPESTRMIVTPQIKTLENNSLENSTTKFQLDVSKDSNKKDNHNSSRQLSKTPCQNFRKKTKIDNSFLNEQHRMIVEQLKQTKRELQK